MDAWRATCLIVMGTVLATGVDGGPAGARAARVPPGSTVRVSVDSRGGQADQSEPGIAPQSVDPAISGSGRVVAFTSAAADLVRDDTNRQLDVFVHDLRTGRTERVSTSDDERQPNGASYESDVDGTGRFVAFTSEASNLVAGDTNGTSDVFVRDRRRHRTERVSLGVGDEPIGTASSEPSISADGRRVLFQVRRADGSSGAYLHDRRRRTTGLVSIGPDGEPLGSARPVMSTDGRFVAFVGDPEPDSRVSTLFVRDLRNGTTEAVASTDLFVAALSGDGRYVAYEYYAGVSHVAVYDRVTHEFEDIPGSGRPALSADGRYLCYTYRATEEWPSDEERPPRGVYVRDRLTGAVHPASVSSTGEPADDDLAACDLSSSGQVVAFASSAPNLVADDTNQAVDVFVHRLAP